MEENLKIKYPIGIQSFAKLREEGYIYVDKTAAIYGLVEKGGYFFLSRPRRFGKSLLLSTIEAYYQGRRDLFKGLAIDSLSDDWTPRPVIRLDLNYGQYINDEDLVHILEDNLSRWEANYCVDSAGSDEIPPSIRFNNLISHLYHQSGKKVVILIDEYDKPLLNSIGNKRLTDLYRSQLKAFYSNLKTMDEYIEFAMLTGVARFSKVSIFSDLNNLRDITFLNQFSSICGITSAELDQYFPVGITALAEELEITYEETRERLKKHYDGYHFSEKSPDMYNPFSLINALASSRIGDYWFASGTPTYLVRLLERGDYPFREIAPVDIDINYLESAGVLDENPEPVFYQSGYLTIKGFDREFNTYLLDYPNEEVRRGFLNFLMWTCFPISKQKGFSIPEFVKDVRAGRIEEFMKRMESLIAGIPYAEKGSAEHDFQNAIYLLFTLLGYYARVEDRTSNGRIDLQVETSDYIYIFEFKVDSSSEEAMKQIMEKKYWLRENYTGKEIYLIGANFDTATRRLTAPLISEAPAY